MKCETIKDDIWRCNILPEDCNKLSSNSTFWQDVLKSWNQFNYSHNFRVENQLIWYNSRIRINNKPVFWKQNYNKGLKYVYQLFTREGFKREDLVQQEFGLSTLHFNSLKVAIPKEWITFFTSTPPSVFLPLPPHNYDTVCLGQSNLSAKIYKYIADDCTIYYNKWTKWNNELQEEICEDIYTFAQHHKHIFTVTNIAKYRSFQYRILQRGLITNIHLEKWSILPSNLCSFCKEEVETVEHLLYSCPKVKEIWGQLIPFLHEEYGQQQIDLTARNVILNTIVPRKNNIINFICLITKHYIYSQRCLKGQLNVHGLKNAIKKIENIEKYIAVKNDKLAVHSRKWNIQQNLSM